MDEAERMRQEQKEWFGEVMKADIEAEGEKVEKDKRVEVQ